MHTLQPADSEQKGVRKLGRPANQVRAMAASLHDATGASTEAMHLMPFYVDHTGHHSAVESSFKPQPVGERHTHPV